MIQAIAFGSFFLDQLSKYLVLRGMSFNESIPVLPPIFHLTLIPNTGIAFGLFKGNSGFFVLTGILILLWIYLFLWKHGSGNRWALIGLGLVSGGALGNLVDRLRYGYVIDFLDFRIWPIFNVADCCISVGAAFFFLACLRK